VTATGVADRGYDSERGALPGLWSASPVSSLFEFDYLIVEHAKICDGWSRHWVVAWLWFLS